MDNGIIEEFEDLTENFDLLPQDVNEDLNLEDSHDLKEALDAYLEWHTSNELYDIVNEHVG